MEKYSFNEYLSKGWKINLSLAIDFTMSNGKQTSMSSYHYIDPTGDSFNDYQQAIMEVASIVEPYSLDKKFALFGFGGIPQYLNGKAVSHCFNLNGLYDPSV